jgi:hypothetical protein
MSVPALAGGGSLASPTVPGCARSTTPRRSSSSASTGAARGAELAERLAEQIRVWDRDHRRSPGPVPTVYPAGTPAGDLPPGTSSASTTPPWCCSGPNGRPVVEYFDGEVIGPVGYGDLGAGPGGVLQHVGQRLLYHPVSGEVRRRRQRPDLPGGPQPDRDARGTDPVDQGAQLVKAGLRSQRRIGVTVGRGEHAEQLT